MTFPQNILEALKGNQPVAFDPGPPDTFNFCFWFFNFLFFFEGGEIFTARQAGDREERKSQSQTSGAGGAQKTKKHFLFYSKGSLNRK